MIGGDIKCNLLLVVLLFLFASATKLETTVSDKMRYYSVLIVEEDIPPILVLLLDGAG